MAQSLLEFLKAHPFQGFKPIPHLSIDGKQIGWFWEDESCYAESIMHDGKWVGSIYKAQSDKRIVGVSIHQEAIQ